MYRRYLLLFRTENTILKRNNFVDNERKTITLKTARRNGCTFRPRTLRAAFKRSPVTATNGCPKNVTNSADIRAAKTFRPSRKDQSISRIAGNRRIGRYYRIVVEPISRRGGRLRGAVVVRDQFSMEVAKFLSDVENQF